LKVLGQALDLLLAPGEEPQHRLAQHSPQKDSKGLLVLDQKNAFRNYTPAIELKRFIQGVMGGFDPTNNHPPAKTGIQS
jgi:hypothetical protein